MSTVSADIAVSPKHPYYNTPNLFLQYRRQKNSPARYRAGLPCLYLFAAHIGEALAAIDRTILAGLERNSGFLAAVRTDSGIHFTVSLGGVLTRVTARLAALGLVYKALGCVELLFTGGKYKFIAAFLADESLVLVHCS